MENSKQPKGTRLSLILIAIAFFVIGVASISLNGKQESLIYTLSAIFSIIMCAGCLIKAFDKNLHH